ncbi:hypothetical protein ABOM_011476 [Aspergillus bombycis]|uniref:Rhodopsin domain-containing protein n=1 Tax=Aspergillus bombycis TaxID=109264 RepID=A0A1F7ZKR1_9EURO|nr:hypothetical protein ABOM_011476 [Aspergillus bombycis]OGM40036.1 hypothetical protein ABOM_011476 [Aspergillus bombycis]
MAIANGYGKHSKSLSETSIENIMKSQYAAAILFIASMLFSKLSVIYFIRNVTPAFHPDRLITASLQALTILWAGIGILTAAFQCKLPRTWDYVHGQCIQRGNWWNYLCVMNILTDTGVMAYGIFIVVRLQMRLKRKVILMIIFGLRTFVIAASACQAFYANQAAESPDPMSDTSPFTISTQVTQCLGLITCCSPELKPFIENLRSLGFYVDGKSRHDASAVRYNDRMTRSHNEENPWCKQHELETISHLKSSHRTVVTASSSKRDWDEGSQSSQAHIIHEVRTWTVTESV